MVKYSIALVVIASVLFFGSSKADEGTDEGCTLLGQTYRVGQLIHPKLEATDSNYCVTCKCYLNTGGTTDLNCTSILCPLNCTSSSQDVCCQICSDSVQRSKDGSPAIRSPSGTSSPQRDAANHPFAPPILAAGESLGGSFSQRCVVGGISYSHGDTFPENGTQDLQKGGKCSQCICNNGNTSCRPKICPSVTCSNPLRSTKDCCLSCPGAIDEPTSWDTIVTFTETSSKSQKVASRDCKSGDRYFTNGATWHPVIGPFGEMDCVLCKCHFGKIECARLKCDNRKNLPCDKPVKVTGQCCPVCQNEKHAPPGNREMPMKMPQERRVQRRCISTRSDFTVWKSSSVGMSSEVIQYLFAPFGSKLPRLEIHHHRIMQRNNQVDDVTNYVISSEDYTRLKSKFHFNLLGGTTRRLITKLEKRENKMIRKCRRFRGPVAPHIFSRESSPKYNPCSLNISTFEDILKLKKIQLRQWCGGGQSEI